MLNLPIELINDFNKKWDEFCSSSRSSGLEVPDWPLVFEELKQVFACSDFVSTTCTRDPLILFSLIHSGDLHRRYSDTEYSIRLKKELSTATDDAKLGSLLRKHRKREMVRIAWRDLAGLADLSETVSDLSSFADACIEETFSLLYRFHCEKYGAPLGKNGDAENIAVLGMGKLGAQELNFSSDVDLIFAYPESGMTNHTKHPITHEEFFTGLCRRFLKVFGSTTNDGLLFRVDARLRPFGENGPLIMSFSAMEEYYQRQGREWERYALIKARVVAGDKEAGNLLIERLRPFIFRRYLDYGVYDALREMKEKISLEVERKGLQDNIKLGPGGIREVEFFGQIFQLIRGGVEPELQERQILKALSLLVQEGYIPTKVCDHLSQAYIFLRNTEHRLQEFKDQQTHELPSTALDRMRLAVSLGFESWQDFLKCLESHRANVHLHFNELLVAEDSGQDQGLKKELNEIWQGVADRKHQESILLSAGFEQPDEIYSLLEFLRNAPETRALSQQGRDRLDKLIPILLKNASSCDQPSLVVSRLVNLVKAIEQRTCYISLLIENPEVLTQLVKLSAASPWIISFLARHPVLLDELLDPRTLYAPLEKTVLETKLRVRLDRAPNHDLELLMEELAIFKQTNIFHVAATDVFGAFPLMKISDFLSYIAEVVLKEVLSLAWNYLINKHGLPHCMLGSLPCDKGFAIISYGKLGGYELGYGSDLDLVFLHAGDDSQTQGGSQPIETAFFFSRLGQRIIHLLTSHTRAGKLYDIDMRLRPSGSSGPLVSHIDAFRDYQLKEAWTWEHQALVRARSICGDAQVARRFEELRKEVLCRYRNPDTLLEDIRSMRHRMRKEHDPFKPGFFNLKQGRGGIVDIEFLVQYLVLLHAHKHVEIVRWPDNVRQLEALSETGILAPSTALMLKEAYLTFREEVHRLSLQEKEASVPDDKFKDLRSKVQKVWDLHMMGKS